jgi:uncharacterized protein (DUF427 family)
MVRLVGATRNRPGCPAVVTGMTTGHKITITPADAHIEVILGGEKLAQTDRAMLLQETGLPPRYYLPTADVRMDLLRPTASTTTCPFKGQASYWSAQIGDDVHADVVWSYLTPIPEAVQIAGLMCFYNDRVQLTVQPSAA